MENDLAHKRVDSGEKLNPFISGLLSFVFLGLGQAYNGQRWKAYLFVGAAVLFGIVFYAIQVLSNPAWRLILWLMFFPACIFDAIYSAVQINNEKCPTCSTSLQSLFIYLRNILLVFITTVLLGGLALLGFWNFARDKAEAYITTGNYDAAIVELKGGAKLIPGWFGGYYRLGWIYSKKGNYDQAIAELTKAIQIRSNYGDVYMLRGSAYSKKGDFKQAISDLSRALAINPNNVKAYNNRANAYFRKGDKDKALADCEEILKRDLHSEAAYYARNNIGFDFFEKNNFNQSLLEYDEAIKIKPDSAIAYFNRGLAYYIIEQYDKAFADYEKAVALDSDTKGANEDFMKYAPAKKHSDLADVRGRILKLLEKNNDRNVTPSSETVPQQVNSPG